MPFRTFDIANVVHFGETTKHLAEKLFSETYHGLPVLIEVMQRNAFAAKGLSVSMRFISIAIQASKVASIYCRNTGTWYPRAYK